MFRFSLSFLFALSLYLSTTFFCSRQRSNVAVASSKENTSTVVLIFSIFFFSHTLPPRLLSISLDFSRLLDTSDGRKLLEMASSDGLIASTVAEGYKTVGYGSIDKAASARGPSADIEAENASAKKVEDNGEDADAFSVISQQPPISHETRNSG